MTTSLLQRARGLASSSSVRAAMGFGVGGLAFALATLLLARYLTPLEFALLALVLALKEFGLALGPAGVYLVINRHRLAPTARLALRIAGTSLVAALLMSVVAAGVYDMSVTLVVLLALMIVACCMNITASALFQSAQRFMASLGIIQVHNFLLLLALPVGLLLGVLTLEFVVAVVTGGYIVVAAAGWITARRTLSDNRTTVPESILVREGLGGLGIGAVVLIMWQAERLMIPLVLSTEDLATFGVLAAIVSAPFRMMQLGMGFTLLPRLRAATSAANARSLILSEMRMGAVICVGGTAAVLLAGPLVIRLIVGDKYTVGLELFVAAIVVGYLRIWESLAVSTVSAVGTPRTLALMNACGWTSLGIAVLGAWALSGFGLQGVIYGVGVGWLAQACSATLLARSALRQRWERTGAGSGDGVTASV